MADADAPKRIKRNRLRCLKCGDVIESLSVHDFKFCRCKAVFIDGGLHYMRAGGDVEAIELLTEYHD